MKASMRRALRRYTAVIALCMGVCAAMESAGADADEPGMRITALLVAPSGENADGHIALNDRLAIAVDPAPTQPAGQFVLFLNDSEVKGLAPPVYTTLNDGKRALVFKLVRNSDNGSIWRELLGAPTSSYVRLTVALGVRSEPCVASQPCKPADITVRGFDQDQRPLSFDFQLISWIWFGVAVALVAVVIIAVWGHARTSTTLRDNFLPQLPPQRQTYSLGRWQMAFWFVLVFGSFMFLYVLLWDYNTVSTQALALMGISGATALAAVAVDAAKDSPADAVNRALQALGLFTHGDVIRTNEEITARKPQEVSAQSAFEAKFLAAVNARQAVVAHPGDEQLRLTLEVAAEAADTAQRLLSQLQAEIQDRRNVIRAYEDKTRPFVSQGWLKDLTTDINGPTVHRIQVLCWTVALGLVFLVGVYRDLAMPPDFSATLLALMGISSAGYVGFKWPEKNN
jgi:hypothetical protein